jgi:hypothetical protein
MLLNNVQPMSEILPSSAPAAAVLATPLPSGTKVILVATAEASEPFRLNPVVISFGLPRSAFKTQVGGQPSLPQPGTMQDGWCLCRQCLGLVFAADAATARCPAGGQHVTRGGYALQCGDGGSGVQAGWCRCSKCQSLTFTGNGGGVCAAGGAHETGASAPYALTHGNVSRG